LPAWLKTLSWSNPITWHTDVLRFLTVGAGSTEVILLEAAAFAVFLMVSFVIAVRTVKHAILT
jgi:ABC-type multidrug transport system permease subunit